MTLHVERVVVDGQSYYPIVDATGEYLDRAK